MKADAKVSLDKEVLSAFDAIGYTTYYKLKLRGKSGVEHAVNIMVEKAKHPTMKKLLIECKSCEVDSTLKIDEVIVFWGKIFDTGADGLIIATSKATENAQRFAEFYGIKIIEARGMNLWKRLMYAYI
jgi:hypothetical protein